VVPFKKDDWVDGTDMNVRENQMKEKKSSPMIILSQNGEVKPLGNPDLCVQRVFNIQFGEIFIPHLQKSDSSSLPGLWWVLCKSHFHKHKRLVRYCARTPLSQERLGRLNCETLDYPQCLGHLWAAICKSEGMRVRLRLMHGPVKQC
jgi:hypothetical protein